MYQLHSFIDLPKDNQSVSKIDFRRVEGVAKWRVYLNSAYTGTESVWNVHLDHVVAIRMLLIDPLSR